HPLRFAWLARGARQNFRLFSVFHRSAISSESLLKKCEAVECARLHHCVAVRFSQRPELVAHIQGFVEPGLGAQYFHQTAEPLDLLRLAFPIWGGGQKRERFLKIIDRPCRGKAGARLLARVAKPFGSIDPIARLFEMPSNQSCNFVDALTALLD